MKLLLDEHISKQVAERLRARGFDVIALKETPQADQGVDDEPLAMWASRQGRALVTYDVHDFPRLAQELAAVGQDHFGIVCIHSHTIPQENIGAQVRALAVWLAQHPGDEELRNITIYLQAAP